MIAWTTTVEFTKKEFHSTTTANDVRTDGATNSRPNQFLFTNVTASTFFSAEEHKYSDSTVSRIINEFKTTSVFRYINTPFVRGFYSDVIDVYVTGTAESVDEQTTSSEFENDPNDIFYTVSGLTSGTIFHTTVPNSFYQQTSKPETFVVTVQVTTEATTNYFIPYWDGNNFITSQIQTTSIGRFLGTPIQTTLTRDATTTLIDVIYDHNLVFDTIVKAETINNYIGGGGGQRGAEVLWFLTGEYDEFILPLNQFGQTATQTTFLAQIETKRLELAPKSLVDSRLGTPITNSAIATDSKIDYTASQNTFTQITSANYTIFPPVPTQQNIRSRKTTFITNPQKSYFDRIFTPIYNETKTTTYAYSIISKIGIDAPDISYDILYTKFEKTTATTTSEQTLLQRFQASIVDTSGSEGNSNPQLGVTFITSFSRTASGDASAQETSIKDIVSQKYRFGISEGDFSNTIRIPSITYIRSIGAKLGNNFGGAYTAQALFGTRVIAFQSHKALIDVWFDTPYPNKTSFLSGDSTINLEILENGYSFTRNSPDQQEDQGFAGFNIIGVTNTESETGIGYLGANGQESWTYIIPPNAYKVIKSNSTFTTVYNEAQTESGIGSLESSSFQAIPIAAHREDLLPPIFPSYIVTTVVANDWFATSSILPRFDLFPA